MCNIEEFGPVVSEKKIFVATELIWAVMAYDQVKCPITWPKFTEPEPFEQT